MHLKSLTMRGFKSFASATTLRLEPGITCVVGPNGSGKSNVVDALAWVMGEQGAKSLRGGKMEDVIFAGTAGRPPLGRAQVSLTIDNTDGALPIDYSEVTISRTMFRSGGSEYAINGTACRLLDIQELLSDSGIGREMHVIVGQGQLDAVLHASPEDRRGFIEEAAGVLKHRKRKEKALRKLDAMQANLTRLADLTAEIRRQLKPLGRQAQVARRAQVIQADLRDAKARLLADDLAQLTATLEAEIADETALRARRDEVERELTEARSALAEVEEAAAEAAPRLATAQETWYRLSGLRERLRGTVGLAADRQRLLAEAASESERAPGRDPQELMAQAAAVREQEAELAVDVETARAVLETAVEARHEAEAAEAAEERRLAALIRAAADHREGLARLAGKVAARRSRVEAVQEETARLARATEEAEQRAEAARGEFAALETQVVGAAAGEEGLDAEHEKACAALDGAEQEVERLVATEREAEGDRATWTARREALELGLRRKDGAGTLLAASDRLSGILGSVAALLDVEPGYENAVAAALGVAADAVVTATSEDAAAALRLLRDEDGGRATLLVADGFRTATAPGEGPSGTRPRLPAGARRARDLVRVPEALGPALDTLLAGAVVVTDAASARQLLTDDPRATAVTFEGDVVSSGLVQGGSPSAPSLIEVRRRSRRRPSASPRPPGAGSRHGSPSRPRAPGTRTPPSGSRWRWTGCTSPTHGSQRSRSSSGSSARPCARPGARRSGTGPPSRPRNAPWWRTARRWPSWRHGSRWPAARRRRRNPRPRSGTGSPASPPRRGRSSWTPGWHCAPRRSGRARSPAAPSSWSGPPQPSARRGRGRRPARSGAAGRPRPRGPCWPGPSTPSTCWSGRCCWPTSCGWPPRSSAGRGARPGRRPATGADPCRGAGPAGRLRAPGRGRPHRATPPHRGHAAAERRGAGAGPRRPGRGVRAAPARPAQPARPGRDRRAEARRPLRAGAAGEAAALGGARARPVGQGQPVGAGGVRGAGGTTQVPHRAAGRPEELPSRPARHRPRGRRARRAGVHRGVRGHGPGVRARIRPALPRRGGEAGPHRPGGHADHRDRRRGPARRARR